MATAPLPATETCNAKTRAGTPCKRRAGFGTDHVGVGRCKNHAGNTAGGKIAAAKQAAEQEAARLSLAGERDIAPHDALLQCVRIAAIEVSYFTRKIAELDDEKVVVDDMRIRRHEGDASSYVERTSHSDLNIFIRARHQALDRLARYSKLAIDAGVAERYVRLEEEQVARWVDGIRLLLDRFGLQDHPDAPAATRAALQLIEGGKAA